MDDLLKRLDAPYASEHNGPLCHSAARRIRELEAQLAEARGEGFRRGIAAAAQAADDLRKTLWTSEPARCVSDIEALHEVEAAIRALSHPADLEPPA